MLFFCLSFIILFVWYLSALLYSEERSLINKAALLQHAGVNRLKSARGIALLDSSTVWMDHGCLALGTTRTILSGQVGTMDRTDEERHACGVVLERPSDLATTTTTYCWQNQYWLTAVQPSTNSPLRPTLFFSEVCTIIQMMIRLRTTTSNLTYDHAVSTISRSQSTWESNWKNEVSGWPVSRQNLRSLRKPPILIPFFSSYL